MILQASSVNLQRRSVISDLWGPGRCFCGDGVVVYGQSTFEVIWDFVNELYEAALNKKEELGVEEYDLKFEGETLVKLVDDVFNSDAKYSKIPQLIDHCKYCKTAEIHSLPFFREELYEWISDKAGYYSSALDRLRSKGSLT